MARNGFIAFRWRPAGVVGYNVQAAVDTEQHLIIAHEVTNSVSDRAGLRIAIRIATKISSVLKLCFAPGDLPPDLPTCYCALRVGTTLRQVRQAVACPRAPVKRESTEYSRLSPWAPLVPSVGTIVSKFSSGRVGCRQHPPPLPRAAHVPLIERKQKRRRS